MNKKPLKQVTIDIEDISPDGFGLGLYLLEDGTQRTVEVPFTLPGERVQATIVKKQRGLWRGRLESILEPSPERVPQRCAHFGACGGCRWQHIPYQKQLAIKEQWLLRHFQPILEETKISPIVPCEPPWQYRNKMEFSFSQDAKGEQYLGLMLQGRQQKVVTLQECHLTKPWFIETLQAVRTWWKDTGLDAYRPYSDSGSLRTLTLREGIRTGDKLAMLTVSGNPEYPLTREALDSLVRTLGTQMSLFLRVQQSLKGRPTQFFEMHLAGPDHITEQLQVRLRPYEAPTLINCHISPSAFFQPNTLQAEKLYSLALQMVPLTEESIVCDLFCGTGTLGLAAARRVKEVIGVELSPESALDARENAKRNNIDNIEIITGDAAQVLSNLKATGRITQVNLVMVDPPRSGLSPQMIEALLSVGAADLLYISCHPKTQARDLAIILKAGYRLVAMQPVDQFPQTIHIENIAYLRKK